MSAILVQAREAMHLGKKMLVTREREKLADAIIYFVKETKYCGVTKLFKLLYFLDFTHYRQTGKPVTGLNYVTWPKGPAPKDLWVEIQNGLKDVLADSVTFNSPDPSEDKKLTKIVATRKLDGRYFTKREKRILDELAFIYREATAREMVEITHLKGKPWFTVKKASGLDVEIPYDLAIDGSDDQLDPEEIQIRKQEVDETRKALESCNPDA